MPNQPIYNATENRYVRNDSLEGGAKTLRMRVTAAQVNAGLTLLAALGAGFAYQLEDFLAVAIGGAASGLTALVLLGTRAAAPVTLVSVAAAGLVQSAVNRAGDANSTVLADGASFTPLDANTPITLGKTGGALATATNIDVVVTYSVIQS